MTQPQLPRCLFQAIDPLQACSPPVALEEQPQLLLGVSLSFQEEMRLHSCRRLSEFPPATRLFPGFSLFLFH